MSILSKPHLQVKTKQRGRTKTLRSLTTLGNLHKELIDLRSKLSRTAVCLRLLPRRGDSREGKRHMQTVPVKLLKSENSLRKKNVDLISAKSFFDDILFVSELIGGNAAGFLSSDDKAHFSLGVAGVTIK